ncbi:hypothetical protein ACIBCO_37335 [Streptomyces violascens]|uniref:hypothetical protein n=1 Tax=Streptomyces violascens TaxID=67381 RepID=UPI00378A7945
MTTISLTDLDKAFEQGKPHHHPHLLKVTKNECNRLSFEFREFTGAEGRPERPEASWDGTLPRPVGDLLTAEYAAAYALWNDAAYVRTLKSVVTDQTGASAQWTAYTTARAALDDVYASLNTTPDTHWRATLSRLIIAQDAALEAATVWDRTARLIARVHCDYCDSSLGWRQAYERAGIDATDWLVRDIEDYDGTGYRARRVQETITDQRRHLKTIASLAGH